MPDLLKVSEMHGVPPAAVLRWLGEEPGRAKLAQMREADVKAVDPPITPEEAVAVAEARGKPVTLLYAKQVMRTELKGSQGQGKPILVPLSKFLAWLESRREYQRTDETAKEKARELRLEGLSFDKIGVRLGITKDAARAACRGMEEKPEAKPTKKPRKKAQ